MFRQYCRQPLDTHREFPGFYATFVTEWEREGASEAGASGAQHARDDQDQIEPSSAEDLAVDSSVPSLACISPSCAI